MCVRVRCSGTVQIIRARCHAEEKVSQTGFQPLFLSDKLFAAKQVGDDSDVTQHSPSQKLGWKMLLKSRKGALKNEEPGRTKEGEKGGQDEGMKKSRCGAFPQLTVSLPVQMSINVFPTTLSDGQERQPQIIGSP